jgi:hypothetical protein
MLFSSALLLGTTTIYNSPMWFEWRPPELANDRSVPPNCGCAIGTALLAVSAKLNPATSVALWPYLGHWLYGRDLPWYGRVKGAAIGWSEHKPLVDWISWLHLNEVASREELAARVAGLEREWQITDSPRQEPRQEGPRTTVDVPAPNGNRVYVQSA